jgi:hypothetical protein
MLLDGTAAWMLLVTGSLGGAILSLRNELRREYYVRYRRWHDDPPTFVGTCVHGTLLGVGTGMGMAVLILTVETLVSRV